MTYPELKEEYQARLSKLSEKVGLFWAFNKDQFKAGIEKYPAKKYTSIGMGGYLPSVNVDEWLKGMRLLEKWFKAEKKKIKKEKVILYELNNYECFYTHDITDACEALKGTYTKEEIREVFLAHKGRLYSY